MTNLIDFEAAKENRERIEKLRLDEAQAKADKTTQKRAKKSAIPNGQSINNLKEESPNISIVIAKPAKIKMPESEPPNILTISDTGRPSDKLSYGLNLLKEELIKSFKNAFEQRYKEYNEKPETCIDAYYEVLVERNQLPILKKELAHWVSYLNKLPDCQHTRGAIMALISLVDLCDNVDNMKPPEDL